MKFIPVSEPWLGDAERRAVMDELAAGWISSEGPAVSTFEQRFARRVGRQHAVAVSSGTAALELAVAALDVGPGDEVILPDFTIISCAAAVVRAGATPVVVDADPRTWNMDVSLLEACITPRTRAIMAVHLYGLPTDMDPLLACAERHDLAVIEDAAEAHGLLYKGRPCGSLGDLSVFSFYANKIITTGEGGMVLSDDADLAARVRSLRNLCFQPEQRFIHEELGWNYRLGNLAASLGNAQLDTWDERVERKRQIGRWYDERLADVEWLQRPLPATDYAENGYWVYGVVLDDALPFTALEAMARLHAQGIGTRPFFWPMHEQPVWLRRGLFKGIHGPVSSRLGRRGFYLPGGLGLTEDQVDRVVRALYTMV